MSLILEALKKSEAERQLGRAPGLMSPTVRVSKPRGPSPWWGVLGLAIAIGAGAAWWAMRERDAGEVRTSREATAPGVARDASEGTQGAPAPAPAAGVEPTQASSPAPALPTTGPLPSDPEFASVERESIPIAAPLETPPATRAETAATPAQPVPPGATSVAGTPEPPSPLTTTPDAPPAPAPVPTPPIAAPTMSSTVPPIPSATSPPAPPVAELPAEAPPTAVAVTSPPAPPVAVLPAEAPPTAVAATSPPAPPVAVLPVEAPPTAVAATPPPITASPAAETSPSSVAPEPPAAAVPSEILPTVDATPAAPPAPIQAPLEALPSVNELMPDLRASLPALKMTMHVYAKDPAARFVLIDGKRLAQGERLSPSLTLAEIRSDGAVLDSGGKRFLVPRP